MSLYFQDGSEIAAITVGELNTLYGLISQNNCQISAQLLADRTSWAQLYMNWMTACVDYLWFIAHNEKAAPEEEQVRAARLFQEGASAEDCDSFLRTYRKALARPGYPNIGSSASAERICSAINEAAEMPAYLRLRAAAVCLLASKDPNEFFCEGTGWIETLCAPALAAKFTANVIHVAGGEVFRLDPAAGAGPETGLVPKTLMNTGGEARSIHIRYSDIDYPVKLPAYGILRAVFSDGGCTRLVSLKGGISCCDTSSAIIQKGEQDGIKLFYAYRDGKKAKLVGLPLNGQLWDASADEMNGVAGAVVLTSNELRSTVTGLVLQKSGGMVLPIRCCRSGGQWARLYGDGRLESNLPGGAEMDGVTAVAEDAEHGLLVCRKGECFDYRSNIKKAVSMDVFAEAMLGRFLQAEEGECEILSTQLMRWAILDSGEVNYERKG